MQAKAHLCRQLSGLKSAQPYTFMQADGCARVPFGARMLRFRLPACTSAFQLMEPREALQRTGATIVAVRPRPAIGLGTVCPVNMLSR